MGQKKHFSDLLKSGSREMSVTNIYFLKNCYVYWFCQMLYCLPSSPFFSHLVAPCISLWKIVIWTWFWWNLFSASEIAFSHPLLCASHSTLELVTEVCDLDYTKLLGFWKNEQWLLFFYQVRRDLSLPGFTNVISIISISIKTTNVYQWHISFQN